MIGILSAALMIADCGAGCPIPVEHSHAAEVEAIIASGEVYTIEIEAVTAGGVAVHRSGGALSWGEKVHYGGQELRGLGFDRPDYDVSSALLSPQTVWTSL